MSETISVTVRLPKDVADAAKQKADDITVSVSEEITEVLANHYGLPSNPKIALLRDVAKHVKDNYDPGNFSSEVILEVFRHIRDTPMLRGKYDAAVLGSDGKVHERRRQQLHQQIAKTVKRVLNAEVFARSVPLTTTDDLIKSFSHLRPFSD